MWSNLKRGALQLLGMSVAVVLIASTAVSAATNAQVLAAVKASGSISQIPTNLTPTLSAAATNVHGLEVTGANWILNRCDPYWVHSQALKPIPCVYGDTHAKKVVVIFGDSNAGNWVPALDTIFKQLHYKLDVFGFIGCTTAPVTETATSQPGFTGQWQLCNTWHSTLPAAVRSVKPVAIMEAASPWMTIDAQERATWVTAMKSAFDQMTLGHPKTVRIELGTTPLFGAPVPTCLATYPSAAQKCAVDYAGASSPYSYLLNRDAQISVAAKAALLPAWQWFCANSKCSPVVGRYMVIVDQDHTSTPYVNYLEPALKASLLKKVKLP